MPRVGQEHTPCAAFDLLLDTHVRRMDLTCIPRLSIHRLDVGRRFQGALQLRHGAAQLIGERAKNTVDLPLLRKLERAELVVQLECLAGLDEDGLPRLRNRVDESGHTTLVLDLDGHNEPPFALRDDVLLYKVFIGQLAE